MGTGWVWIIGKKMGDIGWVMAVLSGSDLMEEVFSEFMCFGR